MITQKLIELDPTLTIHNEGEWSNTVSEFSAFNDAGVECEVGEFLYALVRVLKPGLVLETGTHHGVGAVYMGMGLKENQKGKLHTVEYLPEIHRVATERVAKMGLENYIDCFLGDVDKFVPEEHGCEKEGYGLILLDTEPQTRFAELAKFYPYLKPGGYVFVHDLHRHMHQTSEAKYWPFGKMPEKMVDLIKSGKLKSFHLPTPRGLTGFYKPCIQDYNCGGKDD
jgi:predicted O-methyltransferase YrrM